MIYQLMMFISCKNYAKPNMQAWDIFDTAIHLQLRFWSIELK